jgi:Uma2 family endonuclease
MATTASLTIDDFERLPAAEVENRELVDGELVDVSGNTPIHNIIRDRLGRLLGNWLEGNPIGLAIAEQEFDFGGNAHGPDLSFLRPEKKGLLNHHKRVQRFVPDLAVEIASESDTFEGMLRKRDRYLQCGTGEVWLISPSVGEVAIYTTNAATIYRAPAVAVSSILPGFSLSLEQLFRDF